MNESDKLPPTFFRDVILEIVVSFGLAAIYFFLILQALNEPLTRLFQNDITMYGIVCVIFTITQGFVLDFVTGFVLDLLGLNRIK